jgi:hypothetical protein
LVTRTTELLTVVSDRLDGAAFHGLLAESLLLGSLRLLEDIGVTTVLIPLEIGGCRLAAKITVDALVIAVISAGNVLGILVGYVSHSF